MNVVDPYTFLAADIAAPVEDTMTFLLPLLGPCVVSTAATQQVTTVDAVRADVADSVAGAK